MAQRYLNGVLEDIPAGEEVPLSAEAVPAKVSRFQARAVLQIDGTLAAVETLVAGADAMTQLAWAEATEFQRESPAIASIATAMGWSIAYVDDMFIRASKITA